MVQLPFDYSFRPQQFVEFFFLWQEEMRHAAGAAVGDAASGPRGLNKCRRHTSRNHTGKLNSNLRNTRLTGIPPSGQRIHRSNPIDGA